MVVTHARGKRRRERVKLRHELGSATNFQSWSKITLQIKTVYLSILLAGFEKLFHSHMENYIDKLKMIK